MDGITNLLPLPEHDYQQHLPAHVPMTGIRRISTRESISAAKLKGRPSIGVHSYSSPIDSIEQEIAEGAQLPWEDKEKDSNDAAEPPQVHRVAAHARKRSSTGPRSVPLSAFYRSPNSAMAVGSNSNLQGFTSREQYDRYTPQPQMGSGGNTRQGTLTHHITESSIAPPSLVPDNFFDSGGTIRMEAFIDGKEREYVLRSRGKSYGSGGGRRKDMSFWGWDASMGSSAVGSARVVGEDLFTGF